MVLFRYKAWFADKALVAPKPRGADYKAPGRRASGRAYNTNGRRFA
jgi:hypothetical protein